MLFGSPNRPPEKRRQLDLNKFVTTVIKSLRKETEDVVRLELADPDEWELPRYTAGAHIDLCLTPDIVRQYSLCGDPRERKRYFVAVRADRQGRGGSLHVHQRLRVGDILSTSLPRNCFPLADNAKSSVLIAGGIGLTPFMSMIPVLQQRRQSFHLHVCTRSIEQTPFRAQLEHLQSRGLATFHHRGQSRGGELKLADLFARPDPDTHLYCCGPSSLLDDFIGFSTHWPGANVHYEHFSASAASGPSYQLRLARSGQTVEVAAGETMIDALGRQGIKVPTSCRMGICGACKVGYLAGRPDHRDHCLSDDERLHSLMPCVCGSLEPVLELDL
jgi:vanillate O-demethylase ferredoxin subunit